MTKPIVKIYDLMACDVYMDFDNTGLQKEQHKFLVSFYPTGGAPIPDLVDSITAYGPEGYKVEFVNQVFTAKNRNGHIYDRTTNAHWYMVNLDTGFMKEGEYTIEVRCKNGDVVKTSRFQKSEPRKALLAAYLAHKKKMYDSYYPGQGDVLAPGTALKNTDITWSPLKELADQDAYYIFRLSEGRSGKEFDTQNLVWWDNIFIQRFSNPTAGQNRGKVTVTAELKPDTSYVYFTEITDSNAMGETNICIFQPHQSFRTCVVAQAEKKTPETVGQAR